MDEFDETGAAKGNPRLRRVTEIMSDVNTEVEDSFRDVEVEDPFLDVEPRGVWIPLDKAVRRFTIRVEQPGVFTVEMLDDDLGWGVEWIQDA